MVDTTPAPAAPKQSKQPRRYRPGTAPYERTVLCDDVPLFMVASAFEADQIASRLNAYNEAMTLLAYEITRKQYWLDEANRLAALVVDLGGDPEKPKAG